LNLNELSSLTAVLGTVGVDQSPTGSWAELAIALVSLCAMEIVLGIDNIVFISIATSRLPQEQQKFARLVGLGLAMAMRIILLCFIATIVSWTEPLFRLDQALPTFLINSISDSASVIEVSVRDLILLGGGLYLIFQSVREVHQLTESRDDEEKPAKKRTYTLGVVLTQIALLDLVFSLDSVITAVGMVDSIPVMITAVIITVIVMMLFSGPISSFVLKHPTVKVLALSFLLMIGVMLVAEGLGSHFNKNYIYFAMAFSLGVELLNLRVRKSSKPAVAN
jgi:predicted tellurium resistance membrane protein TerC